MWDWVAIGVTLLTLLYLYLTWHHGYWQSQGVACLPGALPGIGHMWESFLAKKNARWKFCEFYHEAIDKPAVGFYFFRSPALLLRDLDLFQAVLISDFSSFHDNNIVADESIDLYTSRNPFVLRGQKWKTLRQKLTPAFSPARIKSMFPFIHRVCGEFNTYMDKHVNEDVDVLHVNELFTSEVVAKCAFGLDGNAFKDPNAAFYKAGKRMWEGFLDSPYTLLLIEYFPSLNKIIRKRIIPKDVEQFFVSLIKQSEQFREKNPDKAPDNDYLQYLFSLKKKDPEFTLDDVVAQSLTFFTDGFETSALFSSLVVYELTMNPDIQEALRQEIKAMDLFSYDNIVSLPLLDRVVQESLRKYPGYALVKECTKDTVLQSNGLTYPVRKGQLVVIPILPIHRHPDIYPDPEKFDPNRFLPENSKGRHPLSLLSFGAGPRMCIGNKFGVCQMKVLVANMVANFRLLKCEKTVEKIRLTQQSMMPFPEDGIWVRFQRF